MALRTDTIGRTYPSDTYAVGREKIREYARAVGDADLVAPPMFAVVYSVPSVTHPLVDPDVEVDFARLVHGGQEFRWGALVVAGDEITTTTTIADISERGGLYFYVLETQSVNQLGETVCTGTWTNIVRPEEAP
jgi:acyl dehydratase